ncbi:MAG TPA: DNA primase [Blastocatellia bacterium]|nr:DNA primase [Blastocatellia bacterium]
MRLPSGFADEVRNQADIVRVISDYLTLKKRGANHIACCPFHSEKTPSFNVHQAKGIYKCFGCGAGGTVFDFVMQMEGCSFPEAVRTVANKSGIPIPAVEETADHRRLSHDRDTVLKMNEWAADFFEAQLEAPQTGVRARAYIESRGITEETRKLFRLGFAPDRWDALTGYLKDRGATVSEMEISGLVTVREDGGFYDRFRGRVIFPIADSQDRIIAFGGRVMGEGEPKYLNSPETAVYTKGHNLFALSLARNEIRKLGYAVLVEGYLDCIVPMQEGVRNIVASLGTALTPAQVRLLRRYMDQPKIVVNFDPDAAGQSAALRSIEMFLAEGFKVNVLNLPTGEDPDEYVRSHGVAAFKALFVTAQPYIDFVVERAIKTHDTSRPSGKVEAVNAILPHLVRMPDKVGRADYAEQIADRLKVDSRIIREELKRAATTRNQALDPKRLRTVDDVTQAERQLLELILARADVRSAVVKNLTEEDYRNLATETLFAVIIDLEANGSDPTYDELSVRIESDFEMKLLPGLLMSDLAWAGGDDFDTLFKKATQAMVSLKRRRLEKQLGSIQIELVEAERVSDLDRVLRLYQEKAELKRRMLQLSA